MSKLLFSIDEAKEVCSPEIIGISARRTISQNDWFPISMALHGALHDAARLEAGQSEASNKTMNAAYTRLANAIDDVLRAAGTPEIPNYTPPVLAALSSDLTCRFEDPLQRIGAGDALRALPDVICAVRDAARTCATRIQDKKGKPRELALDLLFREFAGIFYTVFGGLRGTDRGSADNEAVLWARAILQHVSTVHLSRSRLDGPGDGLPSALGEVVGRGLGLASATVGDRLRSGFLEWCALPDDLRWPAVWWVPHGLPDRDRPYVPKWLDTADIPARTNGVGSD